MSILFPSALLKPSAIIPKPSNTEGIAFDVLYAFDASQEEVIIDGAIFTEASEPLTTEQNEILLFEPA